MFDMTFNDEECQYINKITEKMTQEQAKRGRILETLAFAREITDRTAEDILMLIDGLYSKIDGMSDDKWEDLKRYLPFPVSITADDDDYPAVVQ